MGSLTELNGSPVKLRRPATLDHLRKKQRPWQVVEVCLDMGAKREHEAALDRLGKLERSGNRTADALDKARAEVEQTRVALDEATVEMLFQGIGRVKREALEKAHPPTSEDEEELERLYAQQMEEYAARIAVAKNAESIPRPRKEKARYNARGFSIALIALSCSDPKLSAEEWTELTEDWTENELTSLFMVALRVNSDSSLVTLGKASQNGSNGTAS